MNTNFAQRQPTRPSSFASPQTQRASSFAPRPFATPTSQGGTGAPSQEPYEREAERVAGQVMRSARSGDGAASPPASLAGTSMPAPAVSYSGSGGRALPEPIRHRLGQSLGADLGSVRVHTDARADRLNRSLDSNAATVGGNIFFRHGEYQPESRAGQELIAHEAVHTVHQGAVEQSGGGDAGATIGLRQSPLCGPQRSGATAKSAEERLARAEERSAKRKQIDRMEKGRIDTPFGLGTVSGLWGQRMTQTRKGDYGGETFGSVPAYGPVMDHLPDRALPGILNSDDAPTDLTDKEKLAGTTASLLTHVSEEDREPGSGKFARALIRRRIADSAAPHPFDPNVNPAVTEGGPQKMRDLIAGSTPLSAGQRSAIDQYASDSSASEDEYYGKRKGLMRRRSD